MTAKIEKLLRKNGTGIFVSVLLGFTIGTLVLLVAGFNPIQAYASMFRGVFGKPKYLAQVFIKATPIILTALSVSFASKTGLFNIGAEGQYVAGTIAAAMLGHYVNLPPIIHPIFVLVGAILFGGAMGALAGWLKTRFGIHEVISTIMLNWILLYFNNYVINLPGVKKEGTQATNAVQNTAKLLVAGEWKQSAEGKAYLAQHPILSDIFRTDLHWGILIAVLLAVGVWFFLRHTTSGYAMRAVGINPDASRLAGINVKRNMLASMFIAGALAGVAGAVQILGSNQFRISVLAAQEGYGWDGISVALMAGYNPIACLVSGFLFSALKTGGETIQLDIGAPSEVINIMIGTIVFCIAIRSVYIMIADQLASKAKGGAK